jgi:hypothetical protein
MINMNEDNQGNIVLTDITEINVNTMEQIFNLINLGAAKRIFASTNFNQISSRSHAILKLNV